MVGILSPFHPDHGSPHAGKCFKGGSQPASTPSETTTKTEPWAEQKPYLTDVYKLAQTAYGETPKEQFQGSLMATPTATQQQALGLQKELALTQLGRGTGGEAVNLGLQTLRGDYLRPETNPFLEGTINAAIRPVEQKLLRDVLPQVGSQAISQGAYGGARQQLSEEQAMQAALQEAMDVTAKIGYENYARERGAQLAAPQLISAGMGLEAQPISTLSQVGAQEQLQQQDIIDEQLAQWQLAQEAPWLGLGQYAQLIQGGYPGSTTAASYRGTQPSTASGVLSGALGGGMLGYGLGGTSLVSGFSPLAFLGGPWGGALAGGVLGGLAGGIL